MKRWTTAATVLTGVVSVLVFVQGLLDPPWFRLGVPSEWTWRYDHSPYWDRALFCLLGALLLGWLCVASYGRTFELRGGRLTTFLLTAVGLGFWMQASFSNLGRSGFGQGVLWMGTPKANVDFAEACRVQSLQDLLREAQDPARPFRIHLSTHPPGPVAFYLFQKWAWEGWSAGAERFVALFEFVLPYTAEARQIVEESLVGRPLTAPESATMYGAILLIWLLVALGVVPLFFWAAEVWGPPTAVLAVGLYALIPALLVFSPRTDLLYVPLATAMMAQFHLGLSRRDPAQLAFAGVLTWVALQLTLAFLVVLFLVGCVMALDWVLERRRLEALQPLLWSAVTFFGLVGLCWLGRYNCFKVWQLCLAHNASFNLGRSYLPWLGYNLVDFLMFVGLPVAVFLARARGVHGRSWWRKPGGRFLAALAGTILLLNVSGVNRGEVARLWMFLMPYAAAAAADAMRPGDDAEPPRSFGVCLGLMFLQSVAFKLSLDVLLPSL